MPRSKIYLPDVNFWLALAADSHVFHPPAVSWFSQAGDDSLAFCRVTQMGLLRLITNDRVLGDATLDQRQAWTVYERLRRDRRIAFADDDDASVEAAWKTISMGSLIGKNLWTDAYLAAFAEVRGWSIVTFDRDFERIVGTGEVTILQPD